jgi:lipopolysaccharide transport system permease protein
MDLAVMTYLSDLRRLRLVPLYRARILNGTLQDVRQRYLGSVIGMGWAVLFPLLQLSIYAGLYTFIFKVRPSGLTEMDYVLLVFSGMVPLMAFNDALMGAITSLSVHKSMLLNTSFPVDLIPLRSALAAHIPQLSGLLITLLLGFALGRTSWQAILLVPLFWVLLLMFAIGIGWVLSLLTLVARDIQHGIGLVLMTSMILSPFAYTPEMVPAAMKPIIYINPLSYFVLTFQKLICYGTVPTPLLLVGTTLLGMGAFVTGFIVFQRGKKVFFDYV